MDATTQVENTRATSVSWAAPIRIGQVTLVVRDLAKVSDFYQQVIGLSVIDQDKTSARLGTGGTVLVELHHNANAALNNPREAGLFHTAFLLPTRKDLASWINHIAASRIQLQGASDHLVSEALYLADPEGNGIEVYVDKPAASWEWTASGVKMATERLDIEGLLQAGDNGTWTAAPAASFLGHVHLQVGDLTETEAFYGKVLGFDLITNYPGAGFYSTGRYHHHLGANIWNSRGAGKRSVGTTGLASVELVTTSAAAHDQLMERVGKVARIEDPWGTAITITRA